MDHAVALTLGRVRRVALNYGFRVSLQNRSSVRLLLAMPDDRKLQIVHPVTNQPTGGCLFILETTGGPATVTLNPGECWSQVLDVWPCDVVEHWLWRRVARDVARCRDIPRAKYPYVVWYDYRVDANYFEPDSHCRFEHLCWKAEQEGAQVWTGHLTSNRLHLMR